MTVNFYGRIKEYTKGDKSYIPNNKNYSTLRELLEELNDVYGNDFNVFIHSNESCIFLINGKGIMLPGGLDTKIVSNDKIDIIPFIDAG